MKAKNDSPVFNWNDLMPFKETAVKVTQNKEEIFNANYIKTSYGEENPQNKDEPFGLMIATEKPCKKTSANFWKMIVE